LTYLSGIDIYAGIQAQTLPLLIPWILYTQNPYVSPMPLKPEAALKPDFQVPPARL
jgi:hypothetical protein